jgi:multidrug efflux system outer membrane protein
MKKMLLAMAVGVAIATLSGCASNPENVVEKTDLPSDFKYTLGQNAQIEASQQWWEAMADPELDRLLAKALEGNADVHVASAQILSAEAVLKGSEASFFPVFDLAVDGSRGRQASQFTGQGTYPVSKTTSGTIGMKYEIDLWGRLSDISASNQHALEATVYDKQAVVLTVISGVVKGYLSIREADLLIGEYQAIVDNAEQAVSMTKYSYQKGLSTEIDLQNAENQVRDARASLVAKKAERDLAENALALLVGDQTLNVAASGDLLKLKMPVVAVGLPSALLEHRPDVRKAQADLLSAEADISAAKKAFFPQINLTGSMGKQSSAFSSLMGGGSRIWSAGYGLDLPIFDGGLRMSNLWRSRADRELAVAHYKNAVQGAFKDVNDSIVSLNAKQTILDDSVSSKESSNKVFAMMNTQYTGGLISYKELLAENTTYRQKNIQLINSRFDYLSAWVDFNKSLGIGG